MTYTYTVPEGIRHLRADKALAIAFPDHSRTALQRAFDSGLVTLRGAAIKRDQSVTGGDTLDFAMPDLVAATLRAVDIPLDVVFEDKHLLAVNKASGMVVHPGAATGEDTLVHALLSHCAGGLSGIGGVSDRASCIVWIGKRRASSWWPRMTKRTVDWRSNSPSARCTRNTSRSWRACPRC